MKLEANKFFTYLAIYAANADAEIDQLEIDKIKKNSGENLYQEMFDLFMSKSDSERLNVILSNKEFYETDSDKEKLFEYIKNVFDIDGEINASESAVLRMLKHLIK